LAINLPPVLRTGILSIDQEHLELLTLLGKLTEPQTRLETALFSQIANQLGTLIPKHFESEEDFFRSCGMPSDEVAAHVQAHNRILEQFSQLDFDAMADKELVQSEVGMMIRGWIVDHLYEYDVQIRQYVTV
jgi:hemerythrin-like metal-binding protein